VVFTVTVTLAVAVHPLAVVVLVTVYVVVLAGFAVGLLMLVALNPDAGLHEYVAVASFVSPIAAPEVLLTHVLVNAVPALTVGAVIFTVTVTLAVAVHPLAVVVLVTV
jgi:hypothetical protein